MRTKILLLIVAFCFSGASVFSAMMAWPDVPQTLSAETATKDLGTLEQQQEAEATFVLENHSDVALKIARVLTTCQCTGSVVKRADLSPGGATELVARFRAGASRGAQVPRLDVLYTMADRPRLERLCLYLTVNVRPDYDVAPEPVTFRAGVDSRRTIVVSPNVAPSVRILKAYCAHPAVRVKIVEPAAGEKRWLLDVVFDETKWASHREARAELFVHTDNKREGIHRVLVRVEDK